MSNYTKTTNFAAKDSLPSGNAGKIVKGTEIDAEFNNIATASATKADINDATLTGTTTFGSLNDGTITITGWVDEDNMSSDSAVLIPTQQSVKAYVDSTTTAQDLDVTDGSTSIDIDLDSESLGILGGTGVTSTASGTGVTLAIDSTVATLTGTQTLTNKTLTTPTILTSFTIGSATISEAELEILDGATVTTAELNVLDGITSTTAELNILDGVTSTAAEINILDGVTSTTAELNKLDGFTGTVADLNYAKDLNATGVTASEFDILDGLTATTAELNILDGVTSTTAELNILDGVTATTAELNILDGVTSTAAELNILDGVTSTTAELNILDGVTSTATELNLLDGVTATTAELNYTDGVTSAIQTQLDSKISGADAALTGNVTITTADDTTQLALISTSADANAGPVLDLFRNSVSAADNDLTGQVYFSGRNDADEKTYYGQITSQITDVSNGSEDFALELSTLTAGASNSRLFIGPTETVFNETSADLDFRIESDGNENAFFLEGSSGNVSLSNNLAVTGTATATSLLTTGAIASTAVDGTVVDRSGNTSRFVAGRSGGNYAALEMHVAGASGVTKRFSIDYDSTTKLFAPNGTSEHLVVTSAGSVGIGTSSPISLDGNAAPGLTVSSNGPFILLQDANNSDKVTYISNNTGEFQFGIVGDNGTTGKTEHMRLDTSGNLLVGQSSTTIPGVGNTTAGVSIRGQDGSFFSRILGSGDTNNVVSINRSTADGNILGFLKDATPVGSIGYNIGALTIDGGASRSGLYFGAGAILPRYNGGLVDGGAADLGATTQRFQNLFMSGKLHINNDIIMKQASPRIDYDNGVSSGSLRFFSVSGNTERMRLESSGAIFATGVRSSSSANSDLRYNTSNGEIYYQTSSERYKSNITDLEFDTANLYNLRPVSFDDNETGERCFGLIAEETFEQIPEAVVTRDIDGETVPDSIPYSMLSVVIINEMKKLKVENDLLKERLTALENN